MISDLVPSYDSATIPNGGDFVYVGPISWALPLPPLNPTDEPAYLIPVENFGVDQHPEGTGIYYESS